MSSILDQRLVAFAEAVAAEFAEVEASVAALPIVTPEQYGAVGDGVTDDHAALQAAIDFLVAAGGGTLRIRAETYLCSTALSWSGAPVTLQGSGCGIQPTGGTILKFPTGLSGAVIIQNGAGGLGAGSQVRDLRIKGQGAVAVSDADAALAVGAGLVLQANSAIVHNVVCQGFEGNGAYIYSQGTTTTNANNCYINSLKCYDNLKNGLAASGQDSNSCTIIKLDCSNNGQAGVYENSFLGNIYINPHFAGNGTGVTAVPILIGAASGYNRFLDCYKEVHADSTLLFRTLAGGGGKNKINFNAAEGSVAASTTFTVDDQMADTEWGVQGVTRYAKFGGAGAQGTFVFDTTQLIAYDGAPILYKDNPLTANWFTYNLAGKWVVENGGTQYLSVTNTGVNVPAGAVYKLNGVQLLTARQTGTAANATDLATAITLVNDLKTKLTTHGLIS
jgi:hypothetical protein